MLRLGIRMDRPKTGRKHWSGSAIETTGTYPNPRQEARRSILRRLHLATWRGRIAWAAGILLIAVMFAWTLARMVPPWYQPLDKNDQGVMDTAGEAERLLQFDLREAVERVPLGEQTWTITQDQINSYLAIDMARAIDGSSSRSGKPAQFSEPFVIFSPGEVRVSVRTTAIPGAGAGGEIVTAAFGVGIAPGTDGKRVGRVKLTGVWIGRLRVPAWMVAGKIAALAPAIVGMTQEGIALVMGTREMTETGLRRRRK